MVRPLFFLALMSMAALLTACATKGLLIPLEDDLPAMETTRTYISSLNAIPKYRFRLAPQGFAPDKPYTEWTDADIAEIARKAAEREVDVVAFGRVVEVHSAIGFLKPESRKKTDTRMEFFTIIYPGRHPTLEKVLNEYMGDASAR